MTLKEFAELIQNTTHQSVMETPITDLAYVKSICHSLTQELMSFYQPEDYKQILTNY